MTTATRTTLTSVWQDTFGKSGHQVGLELAKWMALAFMVIDHINAIVLDHSQSWMFAIGRLALPIFCLCFGSGLARSYNPYSAIYKLIAFGSVAQIAWIVFGHGKGPQINIMLLMAATAWVIIKPTNVIIWAAALWVGYFSEGTYGAMALIAAAYYLEKSPNAWAATTMVLATLYLAGLNAHALTSLALPLFLAARYLNLGPSWRSPSFLYYFYPAHIAVLGIIASILLPTIP